MCAAVHRVQLRTEKSLAFASSTHHLPTLLCSPVYWQQPFSYFPLSKEWLFKDIVAL